MLKAYPRNNKGLVVETIRPFESRVNSLDLLITYDIALKLTHFGQPVLVEAIVTISFSGNFTSPLTTVCAVQSEN